MLWMRDSFCWWDYSDEGDDDGLGEGCDDYFYLEEEDDEEADFLAADFKLSR